MKTKRTPSEVISAGAIAQVELERTAIAFADVRAQLLNAIAETAMHDSAGRERLYLSVLLLEPVRAMLIAAINDGVAAEYNEHAKRIMHIGLDT